MSYGGYYKTSYSSSRGRGYNTRGSYRSRGGGESTYYGRGSYRGRSSWQTDPSSSSGYESRSHYTSGSSTRAQVDDSGYHRYARGDEADYSSHDRSYHSESSRKRMRTDHGYVQAPSSHRSHETGYEGEDYNNRYYAGDKENYSYHDERRTSSSFRDRSRDDYSHLRKQEPLQVTMPASSSRYMSSSRGSYRSRPRGMSVRGYRGAISKVSYTRRPTSVFARRRTLTSMVEYGGVRKRIVSTRTQADTLRKIRIAKLRRIRELTLQREALKRKLAREEASKGTDEEDDDDENEKEDETGEGGETKSPKKKTKVVAKKKSDDADKDGEEDDEEDDDAEEEDAEEGGEDEEDEDKQKTEETEGVKKKVASKTEGESPAKFKSRPFIKLTCPHCYTWCVTFQEYNNHLYSYKHTNAVQKLWQLHKAVLTQLRAKQRKRQRMIDSQKESEDVPVKSKYCMVCKLTYGELKSEHIASEYHKKIMDFMKPFCRICKYKLATPMLYEKHLCSLEHIKRKALLKSQKDTPEGKPKENGSEAGGDEEKDLDLDNFMTLDSVGTFDGEENKKGEDAPKEEKKKTKADVNPGSEHIKKLKVQYCELCRMYLTRSDKSDKAVSQHCQSRTHLAAYMRYHQRAERFEAEERRKKLLAKKKAAAAKKKEEEEESEKMDVDSTTAVENDPDDKEKSASKDKASDAAGDALELDDEKMWADVDKDLGDILREVEPDNKSSDEDDEGGRYDRFKYSKKGKDSEKTTEDSEDKSAEADNKEEDEEEEGGDAEVKTEAKSATPSPTKKSATAAAASN